MEGQLLYGVVGREGHLELWECFSVAGILAQGLAVQAVPLNLPTVIPSHLNMWLSP